MADIPVTIVLPAGGARRAEFPDDVPVGELMAELTSLLKLPSVGPDGRPMGYRLDSKALGRELTEKETLASAGVAPDDRLMITADITAGAGSMDQSPRMRRLKADYQLIQELAAQSDMISIETRDVRPGTPPEKYIVTYRCKSIVDVDRQGKPKFAEFHQVEIYLHNQYPQRWPGMKWLTPIWHPNINHLNGTVCIDAAWWAASRSLDRLVIMLGEMLEYKNFHDDPTKPPFPWDVEAARWCREYREKNPGVFPLDKRELLRPERVKILKSTREEANKAPVMETRPSLKLGSLGSEKPAKTEVKQPSKAAGKQLVKLDIKKPAPAASPRLVKLEIKQPSKVESGKPSQVEIKKSSRIKLK